MKRIAMVCIGLLLLQGCGGSGDDGPTPTPLDDRAPPTVEPETPATEPRSDDEVPARFVGVWQSDCRRLGDFTVRQLIFLEPDEQELGSLVYSDDDCGTAQLETRLSTDFAFGEERTLADGSVVTEVDLTIDGDVRTIPLTFLQAVQLSLERFCGIDDWVVGVEYDTSDCAESTAEIQPLVGRTTRRIYSVQDDELFIGDFTLDFRNPFRRVTP